MQRARGGSGGCQHRALTFVTRAAEAIGAARHERTRERVADRNGSLPKQSTTKAGDVQLRIRGSRSTTS